MSSDPGCDKRTSVTLAANYEERLAAIEQIARDSKDIDWWNLRREMTKIFRIAAGRPQVAEEKAE